MQHKTKFCAGTVDQFRNLFMYAKP